MGDEVAPVLEAIKLDVELGGHRVLTGVELELEGSDLVALIGPNGAGKSSLLGALAGLHRVKAGRIKMGDLDVTSTSLEERSRLGISLLPEGRGIFPGLTVRENLFVGGWWRRSTELEPVLDVLPELSELLGVVAGRLTRDEQQLCAFGRVLMSEPSILLIDEFSLGLSPFVADRLVRLMPDVSAHGTAILVVEQDVERVLSIVDRAYVLEGGRIIKLGTPYELLADPDFVLEYLWGS